MDFCSNLYSSQLCSLSEVKLERLLIFYSMNTKRGWDKSPSLLIVFGLSSKTQWLSGLYYADFISFCSPTQLCGGGTTKSNSNELPISVPLSFLHRVSHRLKSRNGCQLHLLPSLLYHFFETGLRHFLFHGQLNLFKFSIEYSMNIFSNRTVWIWMIVETK